MEVGQALPHILMIATQLSLALLITLTQYLLAGGLDATVFTVYQQFTAAVFLACCLPFFERRKRPPISIHYLSSAFLIGVLQVPIGELLVTASMNYVSSSFSSVALNTVPILVLVLAVVCGREKLVIRSVNGFAKLLGILVSTAGSTAMILISDSGSGLDAVELTSNAWWLGCLMCALGVLGLAAASITMEVVALRYPADLTLSTVIVVFGTLQTLIVSVFTARNPSSWKISWSNKLQVLGILYGGIIVTGLGYFARIWVIRVKGPVFAMSYAPLLIVFSFILQVLVYGSPANFWRIMGALMVVVGLYLVLWAKSKDYEIARVDDEDTRKDSLGRSCAEPLLIGEIQRAINS